MIGWAESIQGKGLARVVQIKLERLPDIARAFVHIDYETSHEPEHKIH